MSIIDSQTILQREMLGKGTKVVLATGDGASTSADFYMVHFPVTTTVEALKFATNNCTISSGAQTLADATTYPAGTTIHARITEVSVTKGIAICYSEHDNDTTN